MTTIHLLAKITALLALLVGAATFLVPAPSAAGAGAFHGQFAATSTLIVLLAGSAALLLAGLKGFTAKFKLGYILLCTGSMLMGFAFLQIPVLMLTVDNIVELQWVTSGAIVLPFTASALLLYFGTRTYARLFGVRGWRSSVMFTILIATALAALATFLPHAPWYSQSELAFDGTVAPVVFSAIVISAAGWLAYLAQSRASALYVRPLRLLAYGVIICVMGSVIELVAAFFIVDGIEKVANGLIVLPNVISGFVWLRAAVAFNEIRFNEKVSVVSPVSGDTAAASSSNRVVLDAVICLASLVSSPAAVDSTLDSVRYITSRLGPEDMLSEDDRARLAQVYRELENYLTTKDPVRRYKADELRSMVARTLHRQLTDIPV